MGIEYKWVNWTFDRVLWSEVIKSAIEKYGIDDLAEISEVSTSTLYNWSIGRYQRGFEWPHMVNFLKLTNLLDLDPRKFFALEE